MQSDVNRTTHVPKDGLRNLDCSVCQSGKKLGEPSEVPREEIGDLDAERDEGSGTPLIIQLYCNINNPLPILMSALLMIHPRATEVEEPTAQMGSTSFVGG